MGVVSKSDFKENPMSDLDLDLGYVNLSNNIDFLTPCCLRSIAKRKGSNVDDYIPKCQGEGGLGGWLRVSFVEVQFKYDHN